METLEDSEIQNHRGMGGIGATAVGIKQLSSLKLEDLRKRGKLESTKYRFCESFIGVRSDGGGA